MKSSWLLIFGSVFFGLGMTAAAFSAEAPDQKDALWQSAVKEQAELEATRALLHEAQLETYLKGVVTRLWRQTETSLPKVRLRIIQDPCLDVFTYPNGICYFTTGMLAHLQNEDQLAMILAHEMAHYIGRHTRQAWDQLKMDSNTAPFAGETDYPWGALPEGSEAQFCTSAELQADAQGLKWMRQAGYCPGQVPALMRGLPACGAHGTSRRKSPSHSRLQAMQRLLGPDVSSGVCAQGPVRQPAYSAGIAPALLANARAAMRRGLWRQAWASLLRYFDAHPDDAEAYYLKGELLRRDPLNPGYGAAASAYQKAIGLDHNFAPAFRALGMVFLKHGQKKSARHYFETFLALSPDSPDNEFIKGYLNQCAQ